LGSTVDRSFYDPAEATSSSETRRRQFLLLWLGLFNASPSFLGWWSASWFKLSGLCCIAGRTTRCRAGAAAQVPVE